MVMMMMMRAKRGRESTDCDMGLGVKKQALNRVLVSNDAASAGKKR